MPYRIRTFEDWEVAGRRMLVAGAPNMGKTRSLLTWPRPLIAVMFPGELGGTTLPVVDGVTVIEHQMPVIGADVNWTQVISETKLLVAGIAAGKYGDFKTLALDGLHKLHWPYLMSVTGGQPPSKVDGRKAYPEANTYFFRDLRNWLLDTRIPYLTCTVWIAPDKEDPANPNSAQHWFAALPGQAGRDVAGEFALSVCAERQGSGKAAQYYWLTRPDPKIFGVGLKLPPEIADAIPDRVPQDFGKLEPFLKPKKVA